MSSIVSVIFYFVVLSVRYVCHDIMTLKFKGWSIRCLGYKFYYLLLERGHLFITTILNFRIYKLIDIVNKT